MIPEYSKSFFEIKDTDSKQSIFNKQYHKNKEQFNKEFYAAQRLNTLNQQLQSFSKQYNGLKNLKGKGRIQELEILLAMEELGLL